jgi:coenzyme F420-reducing hydrogenase gamma subunit
MSQPRPRLGVFKFASCDGCQLTVLDCEDELLTLAARVEIAYFVEALSRPLEGEFDVSLVEGSVSTPEQEDHIRDIRQRSRFLITLGACAAHGGIQALRNFNQADQFLKIVYASPQYIQSLDNSRPATDYVRVDLQLQGCPVSKQQLLAVLSKLLLGSAPRIPNHALCLDCKRKNLVCVLVARGEPCMGPVTTTGCGVLCPSYDRPCYSCFGPSLQPNTASLAAWFKELGFAPPEIERMFHGYYSQAPAFKEEGQRHADATA